MPESHPGWVTGINDFEARLATGALVTTHQFTDQLDPLRVRSGLRDSPSTPGRLTLATNRVTVLPFQAVIQDPARPALGAYVVTLDAPKELPLTASDPSLNRTDLVIAEIVTDAPGFLVRVVEGERTSNTTPQPPTVTNPLHLRLGQIFVPSGGATPTYTDTRQFTAALGGILPVRGNTDLPSAATGPQSQFIYRLDTRELQVRSGNNWVTYRPPRGSVDTWHALSASGWSNYGSPYAPGAYTITEDGWVRLRGLVKTSAARAAGAVIYTLPSPYQPRHKHIFTAMSSNGPIRLDVNSAGQVLLGPALQADDWLSLEGVAYAALATYTT
ncbi:hypothetical protein ACTMTJ_04150 [Phytohabitans sp. LJ34]|uniref:hypothetical protein n=1 Tax=Phytohabitans sp. LJ34 TaxID=3452217 RepID=UPI003F897016